MKRVRYHKDMKSLITFLIKIVDFLFPISCIICDHPGPDLCNNCCLDRKWPKRQNYPWITSLWNYRDDGVETLVRHIKNQPNNRLAGIIARLFSERILNRPSDSDSWILIPIPISRKRFRDRGFNQSEILAQSLSRQFGFALLTKILVKTIHTKKQGTSASQSDRLINVANSFKVTDPAAIQGKNIILVDDVTTTGSTLVEARNTLLHAGARRVIAWTIAN